jgi:hypothetical protein
LARRLARVFLGFLLALLLLYTITSWTGIILLYVDRWNGTAAQGSNEDYIAFYAAGRLILEGRGAELYELEAVREAEHRLMGRPVGRVDGSGTLAYFNPPFVALALAPLAALPLGVAAALLGIGNAALALLASRALFQLIKPRTPLTRAGLILGFLSFFPVLWTVIHGQFSLLLVIAWLGVALSQVRGQQRLTAISLAVLLIKPQMVILALLVLAIRSQWRALGLFAAVAASLTGVSVVISGPAVIFKYPAFLLDSTGWNGDGISPERMLGFGGLAARLYEVNGAPYVLLTSGLGALTVITLLSAVWVSRGSRPETLLPIWGATIMATLLVNPHLYIQDLTLIAAVLALGASWSQRSRTGIGLWVLLSATAWFALYLAPRIDPTIALTGCSAVMAILFAALVRECLRPANHQRRTSLAMAA